MPQFVFPVVVVRRSRRLARETGGLPLAPGVTGVSSIPSAYSVLLGAASRRLPVPLALQLATDIPSYHMSPLIVRPKIKVPPRGAQREERDRSSKPNSKFRASGASASRTQSLSNSGERPLGISSARTTLPGMLLSSSRRWYSTLLDYCSTRRASLPCDSTSDHDISLRARLAFLHLAIAPCAITRHWAIAPDTASLC